MLCDKQLCVKTGVVLKILKTFFYRKEESESFTKLGYGRFLKQIYVAKDLYI